MTSDAPVAEETQSGPLWQIGTSSLRTWGGEDPLINVIKQNAGGKDWTADVFDPATQTFLKIPAGQRELGIGAIREGARYNSDFYVGDWIIDWEGKGSIATNLKGGEGPEKREGANRIRETYTGNRAGRAGVQIKSIGREGMRNIRIYRAEHEQALKDGKIFNPGFVRHIARYDIVRPLDWSSASTSRVTRASDIQSMNEQFWGDGIVPIEAQFKLAEEAGVSLWLNTPPRLGAPEGLNERLAGMPDQKQRTALMAARFDDIDASPEWDNYAQAVVDAMEATGYPETRHFYLELANETWNWGGAFSYSTEWYWGLTGGLTKKTGNRYVGNPSRGSYGYFSARLAEALAKALTDAGRSDQQWTMVIGSQTANPDHTKGPLQGVRDYEGGAHKQPMARFGAATTGYYGGLFHNRPAMQLFGRRMGNNQWRDEWLRRFNEDRDGFERFLFEAMAGDASIQNVNWIVSRSLQHKAAAESFGARYIGQYEGSSHDTLDKGLAANPEVLKFYKEFQTGPRGAAITRLHAERMNAAIPGVILSNYQHWSFEGVKADRPWVFNTPWGEQTEAERALFELLEASGR